MLASQNCDDGTESSHPNPFGPSRAGSGPGAREARAGRKIDSVCAERAPTFAVSVALCFSVAHVSSVSVLYDQDDHVVPAQLVDDRASS